MAFHAESERSIQNLIQAALHASGGGSRYMLAPSFSCEVSQLTVQLQCDNASPSCRSCTRRGETCSLSRSTQGLGTLIHSSVTVSTRCDMPLQACLSGSVPLGLDALQVHLFDNFVKSTAATLPFGRNIWEEVVPSLALKVAALWL